MSEETGGAMSYLILYTSQLLGWSEDHKEIRQLVDKKECFAARNDEEAKRIFERKRVVTGMDGVLFRKVE